MAFAHRHGGRCLRLHHLVFSVVSWPTGPGLTAACFAMTKLDASRRAFLRGRSVPREPQVLRPPWAKTEPGFSTQCTRCNACLQACPEGILLQDAGGFPRVEFSGGECTFCQACVNACEHAVFEDPNESRPWGHVAVIGQGCFGEQGIYCRSCGESCEANAISFRFSSRAIPIPAIDASACTGCGACIAACPANAIAVAPGSTLKAAEA